MSIATGLFIIAAVVFGIAAYQTRSLVPVGLLFLAAGHIAF